MKFKITATMHKTFTFELDAEDEDQAWDKACEYAEINLHQLEEIEVDIEIDDVEEI